MVSSAACPVKGKRNIPNNINSKLLLKFEGEKASDGRTSGFFMMKAPMVIEYGECCEGKF